MQQTALLMGEAQALRGVRRKVHSAWLQLSALNELCDCGQVT
jgi:hypothetical protein